MPPRPPANEPADTAGIEDIAAGSACAKAKFAEQGTPPKGFLKGMALVYARALCQPDRSDYKRASQKNSDNATVDALAHYAPEFKSAGFSNTEDGSVTLRHLYTLMVGHAATESSWRWCVGKDPGASNTSAETCEAGLFQTSWNARSGTGELPKLFNLYASSKKPKCFAKQFKGTTTCSAANLKNYGTGDGVRFQELSKECPAFAVEFASLVLRTQRRHYGPINTKKAMLVPSCNQMFIDVEAYVKKNPGVCALL